MHAGTLAPAAAPDPLTFPPSAQAAFGTSTATAPAPINPSCTRTKRPIAAPQNGSGLDVGASAGDLCYPSLGRCVAVGLAEWAGQVVAVPGLLA